MLVGGNHDLHTRYFGYRKGKARKPRESGSFELDVLFDHACECPAVVVLGKLSVSPEVIGVAINGPVPV